MTATGDTLTGTAVEAFAHELVVALLNLELHRPDDEVVQRGLRDMCTKLAALRAAEGTDALRLDFTGGEVLHAGRPLLATTLHASRLLRQCAERTIAALEFATDLDAAELTRLVWLLVDPRERAAFTPRTLPALLRGHGITRVRVHLRDAHGPHAAGEPSALRRYQSLTGSLQESHVAAARGNELELGRTIDVVEEAVREISVEPSSLLALASYDEIDSFTVGHSVRVALLALQVARAAGADERAQLRIGTAAMLHDIGKSRVPASVLFKKGALDDDERQLMAQHPRHGAEILLEQKHIDSYAIGAAFCHHMGANGAGYPRPTLLFRPSGLSRLIRVCDVFEALTAVRPYKPALTPLHAYTIMHRMRDGFDRQTLHYFMQVIGLYPLGTRVILDGDVEAVVVRHTDKPLQPVVRLLHAPFRSHNEVTIGELHEGRARRIIAIIGTDTRVEVPQDLLDGVEPQIGCGCDVDRAPRPE